MKNRLRGGFGALAVAVGISLTGVAQAGLITDPNDPRNWQGATVGTFAALYYGSNTLANRQLVVDNELLDDGIFNSTGYVAGTLLAGSVVNGNGYSLDLTGTGSLDYTGPSPLGNIGAASAIDNHWIQTSGVIGQTVWDLGFESTKAAVFNTIDHGPLPQEAIESTVYLSNDKISWTQAVVERVWLEGFQANLGIKWDGFVYAVGTGSATTFRYASIIHGGPGALINDGDDEINGIMGLNSDFTPASVPLPGAAWMGISLLGALGLLRGMRRRRGTTLA